VVCVEGGVVKLEFPLKVLLFYMRCPITGVVVVGDELELGFSCGVKCR
jgi:hypothetical protein